MFPKLLTHFCSHHIEEIEESNGCNKLRCIIATTSTTLAFENAFGLTNDGNNVSI